MFLVTNWVMYFAPVGVCAALAYSLAREGLEVLFSLIRLILVVYLGMLALVLVVFPAIAFFFRIPFRGFLRAVATPFFLAFSTCSSQTALPRALQNMEDFGASKEVVSFVLPVGYSFNLVGSYTYQVLALMVTSKGIATVPRASVLVLAGTLTVFDLPLEGIALLLAVDQFMDMPRTGVNVIGNCLASAVVARRTENLRLTVK